MAGRFWHRTSAEQSEAEGERFEIAARNQCFPKGEALGVQEMERIGALGHVDDVLAMQGVVGDGAAHGLADAQAIGIVKEGGRGAGFAHLLQLTALFPGVGLGAISERIADGIII